MWATEYAERNRQHGITAVSVHPGPSPKGHEASLKGRGGEKIAINSKIHTGSFLGEWGAGGLRVITLDFWSALGLRGAEAFEMIGLED